MAIKSPPPIPTHFIFQTLDCFEPLSSNQLCLQTTSRYSFIPLLESSSTVVLISVPPQDRDRRCNTHTPLLSSLFPSNVWKRLRGFVATNRVLGLMASRRGATMPAPPEISVLIRGRQRGTPSCYTPRGSSNVDPRARVSAQMYRLDLTRLIVRGRISNEILGVKRSFDLLSLRAMPKWPIRLAATWWRKKKKDSIPFLKIAFEVFRLL